MISIFEGMYNRKIGNGSLFVIIWLFKKLNPIYIYITFSIGIAIQSTKSRGLKCLNQPHGHILT